MITHSPETSSDKQPACVLIVDDNQEVADALAKVLRAASYETAVVVRGWDAVDFAQNHRCAAALVDVHLPDLNGLIVSQKMRALLGPQTPIIMVSGDTSMEVINALPHVGATYFLSKPLNVANLLECLKNWIGTTV